MSDADDERTPASWANQMTASSRQNPELTVESVSDQPIGTVRGHARILVRTAEHEAGTTLRLRR